MKRFFVALVLSASCVGAPSEPAASNDSLVLNEQEYLEKRGLNVMLAHDFYAEGHQGGVGIVQNGHRVATNGDVRLSPTPGQWQPIPAVGSRVVDRASGEISVHMRYPDEKLHRKGFNPLSYPDLVLGYTVKVRPDGAAFRITVDLDEPLPAQWVGKVAFNLELFPGLLFGRSYQVGDAFGIFPRQAIGPGKSTGGEYQLQPLGSGKTLTVAPESDAQRLVIETVRGGELQLLDGRTQHNNGWFVVRAPLAAGATRGALEWKVTANALRDFMTPPVLQVSQVGYHPRQPKVAIIEMDKHDTGTGPATLFRTTTAGLQKVMERAPAEWGRFLRYRYARFDFSEVTGPGMYVLAYGGQRSRPFAIDDGVFDRGVWQPTVEYFLPVQMCHMRVRERYRVWHGLCHDDDARMAPENHNHFDGYVQAARLTRFGDGDLVPGLGRGGWHDAGDYDLRIESQAATVHGLALAWERFRPQYDNTTIDQGTLTADIHRPDGKPDVLQQIEHGALSIVAGYKALGRLYRGIQDASLVQYTHLGDAATMTDRQVFKGDLGAVLPALKEAALAGSQEEPDLGRLPRLGLAGSPDDRWVFTEVNAVHEYGAVAALAAAARALRGFNDTLADDCGRIAQEVWAAVKQDVGGGVQVGVERLQAAIDLLQTTGDAKYRDAIVASADFVAAHPEKAAWLGARALAHVEDSAFREKVRATLRTHRAAVDALERETPYGIPYRPKIWGAAWEVQRLGFEQYFLHDGAPDIFPATYMLQALNFVLGVHPGPNNASLVSGVGAESVTTAYGVNRADESYIPGGVVSGTALIRPDLPELLEWPYLWQQTEYCLGHPTSDYVFLVLAADAILSGATRQ